jgi:hypothetical protein
VLCHRNTTLEQAGFQGRNSGSNEPVVNQVITIPDVLATSEAEEMVGDASARCGNLDLVPVVARTQNYGPLVTGEVSMPVSALARDS